MRPTLLLVIPLCLSMAPSRPVSTHLPEVVESVPIFDPTSALPTPEHFTYLCQTDPVKMLEYALARYQREVSSYSATMEKRERIRGNLLLREVIHVAFREVPFSVFMYWREGADRAEATLYVAGENDGQLLVRPKNRLAKLVGYVSRDPNSDDARDASRFTIGEFGIEKGMARTYHAWKMSQQRGTFDFTYKGIEPVAAAGGRPCHIIQRRVNPPEEDGLTEVTIAIDVETWLQVSSHLWAGSEMIAEYHFRDIQMNPPFTATQFQAKGLKALK